MPDTVTQTAALEASALDELRERLPRRRDRARRRGVRRGPSGLQRHVRPPPRAILRPAGTADVIRAIGLARLTGLPLAIRGGGHSVAGFSMAATAGS